MMHYFHISYYATIEPLGYIIGDTLIEVGKSNLKQIREYVKSTIEAEGHKCKNLPTIMSIDELSEETYKMLYCDGSGETEERES